MCEIIGFPISKVSEVVRRRMADDPCNVVVLPVVRIERSPDEPIKFGRQRRRGGRSHLVMEKLRQLHLELGRSL